MLNLEEFLASYIGTALWSSSDNATDSGGEPLDQNYSRADLLVEAEAKMCSDCASFLRDYGDTIEAASCFRQSGTTKSAQAGHDFWLTRNGHGCGFWDGDWSEPEASALTEASKRYGETHLYVGDDGKVGCE